jgi:hypothetical protein
MTVAALRSRFSTNQSKNFDVTPFGLAETRTMLRARRAGDAGLSASGRDADLSWTMGPHRFARLPGTQRPSRRVHVLTDHTP